jgi:hypothetical protein
MASAQYYWGRMAAALLRLCYAAFPVSPWQFVYVDDFAWILLLEASDILSMSILGFLECLGLPFFWKKIEQAITALSFFVSRVVVGLHV